MTRSILTRLNVACSLGLISSTTSPGASPGSEQPASPLRVILEPAFMPCSTCTSNVFFSLTRHLPEQLPQVSPVLRSGGGNSTRTEGVQLQASGRLCAGLSLDSDCRVVLTVRPRVAAADKQQPSLPRPSDLGYAHQPFPYFLPCAVGKRVCGSTQTIHQLAGPVIFYICILCRRTLTCSPSLFASRVQQPLTCRCALPCTVARGAACLDLLHHAWPQRPHVHLLPFPAPCQPLPSAAVVCQHLGTITLASASGLGRRRTWGFSGLCMRNASPCTSKATLER